MTFKQFFATDKLLHASAGFTLCTIFTTIFVHNPLRLLCGILVALGFLVGKEIYDRFKWHPKPGTDEEQLAEKRALRWDMITDIGWGIMGIVAACFCIQIIIEVVSF